MPDTAKPYVWLQAASDADMSDHATVIRIYTGSYGATATHPLIFVNNGWTYPHGTQVTLGNVGGSAANDVLRGNTFLISDTPGTGNVSYFGTGVNIGHPNSNDQSVGAGNLAYRTTIDEGSSYFAFYITQLDGTDLVSNADQNHEVQGVASVYLEDDDPRKAFGLPYFFVSHIVPLDEMSHHVERNSTSASQTQFGSFDPTVSNLTIDDVYPDHAYILSSQLIAWPLNSSIWGGTPYPDTEGVFQAGRDLMAENTFMLGRGQRRRAGRTGEQPYKNRVWETMNVRTKWDWIAQHNASASPKTTDQSSGAAVPGYAYGDSTVNYRRVVSGVWRVGEGNGRFAEHYGAEIFTDTPSHLEAGQLFTVTNMNDTVLVGLDVRYKVSSSSSVAVTGNIPNNLYFRVKEMVGQFCIRTEAVLDANVNDAVLGTVWVSQFTVNNSGVVTTHPGQAAYDTGLDATGDDNRGTLERAGVVAKGYAAHTDEFMNTPGRIPTTTRFQLHVETINHKFSDSVAVSPMVKSAGTKSSIFEQLQVLGLNVGMRNESIDLSGTLRDTGPVGVDNIRKQVLLNIARTQWLKLMGFWGGRHAGGLDGDADKEEGYGTDDWKIGQQEALGYIHAQGGDEGFISKGKGFGGTTNPRSYACLTIFNPAEQSSSDGKKVDLNPDGGYNIYRGVIKNLSFTQESGRPDIWTWRLTFEVISNEKLATTIHGPEKD